MDGSAPLNQFQRHEDDAYLVHLEIPDGFGEEARSDQV